MATWSGLPTYRDASGVGAGYVPEYWEAYIVPEAIEQARFKDIAQMFPKVGVQAGESYHINLGGTMTDAGTLAIGTKTPIDSTAGFRRVDGTMRAWGRGVAVETRLLEIAPTDPQVKHHAWQMQVNVQRAIEALIRNAAYGATTTRINGGTLGKNSAGTFVINGTYANYKMTADALRSAAANLAANNVPEFPGGGWVCVMHPFQMADLFGDDTAVRGFVPISQYTQQGVQQIWKFEVGMFMNIRIVPTIQVFGTYEQASTGTVYTARAVASGPGGVGWVTGSMPRFYFDPDYEKDFNRVAAQAWRANWDGVLVKDPFIALIQTTVNSQVGTNAPMA